MGKLVLLTTFPYICSMNYLLLDHDGVMTTAQWYGWRFRHPNKYDFDKFDPKCVKILNKIIELTNCEIIVSSDWKLHQPIDVMQEFYEEMGVIKHPIGYTPNSYKYGESNLLERAVEIKAWVGNNLGVGDKWVAVDDIQMVNELGDNFVHTPRSNEGIKQCGIIDKIVGKFNK